MLENVTTDQITDQMVLELIDQLNVPNLAVVTVNVQEGSDHTVICIVGVDTVQEAQSLVDAVEGLDNDTRCDKGVLCRTVKVYIMELLSDTSNRTFTLLVLLLCALFSISNPV